MKTSSLTLFSLSLLLGGVLSHMALVEPAPRRSSNHPGYKEPQYDYDLLSPLGGGFTFPCRGAAPGPTYKSYPAGSSVEVRLQGSAKHLGGHCQFSISYDNLNFVALKTVLGNCISASTQYTVPLPYNLPSGKATFAWTWLNREGNREFYMNCVDIEIQNSSSVGTFSGKKMLVGNFLDGPRFPEFFADDFGLQYFNSQPTISISPSGSSQIIDPQPIDPKPQPSSKPEPQPKPSQSYKPEPQPKPKPSQSSSFKPKPTPQPTPKPTVPGKDTPNPNPSTCIDGKMYCVDKNTIAMCWMKTFYNNSCAQGTVCKGSQGEATCG